MRYPVVVARLAALALASLLLAPFLVATGCGPEEEEPPNPPGHWRHAHVTGVEDATGAAVLEGTLLLVSGGDRRELRAVELESLEDGATIPATPIPLDLDRTVKLGGGGAFAAQGYDLGTLWDMPVDFQGLAVQAHNFVFLGERNHRVIYAGRLRQSRGRGWTSARIERVFVVPGGEQSGRAASDWRDRSPGVVGLSSAMGEQSTEILYVLDRTAADSEAFHLQRLDRYGLRVGWVRIDVPGTDEHGVGGLVRDGARFRVVHGAGRGLLCPIRDGPRGQTVTAGKGVPGPEVAGAGPWRGMAKGPDGTLYLVSGGKRTVVAWQTQPN